MEKPVSAAAFVGGGKEALEAKALGGQTAHCRGGDAGAGTGDGADGNSVTLSAAEGKGELISAWDVKIK